MSPRLRDALLALATLGTTLLVMAVLGEVFLRFWKFNDLRPDPNVIRSLVPNTRVEVWGFESPENNSGLSDQLPEEPIQRGETGTNNLGFRMIDDVHEKRPDERRILLLGDSYLEAVQVDESDRFAELVARQLDVETGGRWTVINAGIRSGSPLQYLMQLHYWAEELQPDIVVVFIGANDSPDDIRAKRRYGVVLDENGVPIRPEKQFSLGVVYNSRLALYLTRLTLFERPKLFALLSPNRGPKPVRKEGGKDWGNVHSWIELACTASEESKQVFRDGTGQYLRMLRDQSARIGADFAVVLIHYPFYFPDEPHYGKRFPPEYYADLEEYGCVEGQGRKFDRFVREFLRENQIRSASIYDRFMEAKRRNPKQKLWHFVDYHFNEVGHRLAAEEVLELIRPMIAQQEAKAG